MRIRVRLFIALLPALAVVAVDVAILTHAVGVELVVRAVPRLLVATVLVVAVAAHSLRVVLLVGVSTVVGFLSD